MAECETVVPATFFFHVHLFPQFHCRQPLLKILQSTDSTLSGDHFHLHVIAYKVNNEERTDFPNLLQVVQNQKAIQQCKSSPSPLKSGNKIFWRKTWYCKKWGWKDDKSSPFASPVIYRKCNRCIFKFLNFNMYQSSGSYPNFIFFAAMPIFNSKSRKGRTSDVLNPSNS